MELPYSQDVYLAILDTYNRDQLIVVIAGVAICIAGMAFAILPESRRGIMAKRLVLAGLAACSIFIGGAHQLTLMADFNFMAPLYGGAWLVQGVILAWLANSYRATDLFEAPATNRLLGILIAVYGIVVHPVIVFLAAGSTGLGVPLAGSSPNPTALVMAGFLLTMRQPPVVTLIVPLLWAAVSAMTAYLLAFPVDYAVSASIGLAIMFCLYTRFNRAP